MKQSHIPAVAQDVEGISALIMAIGEPNFYEALLVYLATVINFDSASAILYKKGNAPELLFANFTETEQAIFCARFLDGAYVISPAYQGFVNGYPDGLYPWSKLMPPGFKQSQMYDAYYRPSCIEDLLYFFVDTGATGYMQFSLGRHSPSKVFEQHEIQQVQGVEGLVIGLIAKHIEMAVLRQTLHPQPLSRLVSDRVNHLLENFEAERLTSRERQIAKLIIMGYSSQSAADKLCISPGTERVHRAKLYAKLNLRSNSELFSYFLNLLTQAG
ncbi:LuxR C-terminal-related transcriptional regulator [Alteromonas sp. C1M14]|uniref:helix-turn-helix domain-containing protein n=1 Tax=Alteromonas sp. C1M14 TaxID=2841567 RepID=UPI001C09E7B9|nr:LuxR C-terminal-related transcriptional regulator [Alteromonas sp. C1M14]MBU2979905.1 LuxR C-terminal-related transcriptional regulator [Alteromonas sp. C1M14]